MMRRYSITELVRDMGLFKHSAYDLQIGEPFAFSHFRDEDRAGGVVEGIIPALEFFEETIKQQKIRILTNRASFIDFKSKTTMAILARILSHENMEVTSIHLREVTYINEFLNDCTPKYNISSVHLDSVNIDEVILLKFLNGIKSDGLWLHLHKINFLQNSNKKLGEFLSSCKFLTRFYCDDNSLIPFALVNTNLSALKMFSSGNLDYASKIVSQNLPFLKELKISLDWPHSNLDYPSFFSNFSQNSSMTSLDIVLGSFDEFQDLNTLFVNSIGKGLQKNTTLKNLVIFGTPKCLLDLLEGNSITHLEVYFPTKFDVDQFCYFIEKAKIESLTFFEYMALQRSHVEQIFSALYKNSSIREIKDSVSTMEDGTDQIVRIFKDKPEKLTRFNSECLVSPDLFFYLVNNTTLVSLKITLKTQTISEKHQTALEKFIKTATNLEQLTMNGVFNGLNPTSFFDALVDNLSLKKLTMPKQFKYLTLFNFFNENAAGTLLFSQVK